MSEVAQRPRGAVVPPRSFQAQLWERFKGVIVITIVVATGLHTYPPTLAFLIVGCCADEYYRAVQQQITNLHTYSEPLLMAASPAPLEGRHAGPLVHRAARLDRRKRAVYDALCVLISMSSLVSYEFLTLTTLVCTLLLLTYLLVHTVEQADKRPPVPVARKDESKGAEQPDSPDTPTATEGAVAPPLSSLLLQPNSPLASAHEFLAVVVLLFGLWYSSWLFSHGVLVLTHPSGFVRAGQPHASSCGIARVVYVILVTSGGENGGMFLGRLFGRTRLTPRISPNKSREGAIAQVFTSAAVSALFAAYVDIDLALVPSVFLGLLLGVVGILGDLFESFLKRSIGVKDCGALIPGAGGMLDRMDGLILTFPTMYYFLQYYAHTSSVIAK